MISERIRDTLAKGARAGESINLDRLLTGSGGLATGAAAGGLAAILLGGAKPKKLMKNAAKLGGAALIGGLAYKAWRDWEAKREGAGVRPAEEQRFLPSMDSERERLARAMARAMIAASKADGHITPDERANIEAHLDTIGLEPAAADFLRRELAAPADIGAVVAEASSPEVAADLYAASLLAIDPNGQAERAWLALLAARLGLEATLVAEIHETVAREYAAAAP